MTKLTFLIFNHNMSLVRVKHTSLVVIIIARQATTGHQIYTVYTHR